MEKLAMLDFERYVLKEYGVEFDSDHSDYLSIKELLESLKVKRISDDMKKKIFDSLIFGEYDIKQIRMDISKMDDVPLAQCQHALQNRYADTRSRFTYPEEVTNKIKLYGEKVRKLIESLHFDSRQEFPFNKELDLFIDALEKSIQTVYKVLNRACLPAELTDQELDDILYNMQEMIAFVLSLQFKEVMYKSTFTKASKITPYWSAEINYLLSDENIIATLKKAGVNLDTQKIFDVFTKETKIRLAISNFLSRVNPVHRVAENMTIILSNENIKNELKKAGINLSLREISEVFTEEFKLLIAVNYISDPLDACMRYIEGDRSLL